MTTVVTQHTTTPWVDDSRWNRVWFLTNILTHTAYRNASMPTRLNALRRLKAFFEGDTRDHARAALAGCLRVESHPRIRQQAIALLGAYFEPDEYEWVFWRLRQGYGVTHPDDNVAMHYVEQYRVREGQRRQHQQFLDDIVALTRQTARQRDLLQRLTHPVVVMEPRFRFYGYELEATINWEDGKLRLYAAKRLPKKDFKKLMDAGYRYVRGDEVIFYASYTPSREDLLYDHFGIGELLDDDTSMRELAENRSERYEGYSDHAAGRASDHRETADKLLPSPVDQPILIGHHSERRHRNALERHDNHMRKYFDESDRADYWERRAQSALARVRKREKTGAISRRIARLEADERKFQRKLDDYPESDFYQQWLWFTRNRLAYERALLAAMPKDKQPLSAKTVEAGGAFRQGRYWYKISKVARVNLFYYSHGLRLKERISTLTPERYRSPEQFQQMIDEGKLQEYEYSARYGDRDGAYVEVSEDEGVTV